MSVQANHKVQRECDSAACFLLERLIAGSLGALIGVMIGAALVQIASLPQLERFWIGVGLGVAFMIWLAALITRAWWQTR